MKRVMGAFKMLIVLAVVAVVGFFVITNWGWVFSKRVQGEIVTADRVTDPSMIMSPRTTEAQIHQYSITIKTGDGKLFTATSVDPQWQSKKGYCVDALLYKYPPWRLSLAGTYYNARITQLSLCPGKTLPSPDTPAAAPGDTSH